MRKKTFHLQPVYQIRSARAFRPSIVTSRHLLKRYNATDEQRSRKKVALSLGHCPQHTIYIVIEITIVRTKLSAARVKVLERCCTRTVSPYRIPTSILNSRECSFVVFHGSVGPACLGLSPRRFYSLRPRFRFTLQENFSSPKCTSKIL